MFCLVDFNYGTTQTTLCPLMSSYVFCVEEIQICGGSQTWPWYVPELANGIFVVVSGNEGDSKLEQVGGELSVSEWQLPPSPTGQLFGAAPLTSSRGSLTSVSVIHYLPTRPGSVGGGRVMSGKEGLSTVHGGDLKGRGISTGDPRVSQVGISKFWYFRWIWD